MPDNKIADPQRAKQFAKAICADVIIYNRAAIEAAIESGDITNLLQTTFAEGRELYLSRVVEEVNPTALFDAMVLEELAPRFRKAGRDMPVVTPSAASWTAAPPPGSAAPPSNSARRARKRPPHNHASPYHRVPEISADSTPAKKPRGEWGAVLTFIAGVAVIVFLSKIYLCGG